MSFNNIDGDFIMNELQKIVFDLFSHFVEVCEKLNLNYYLICGSALGAARHGGFIPWDDDMDVGMHREDYNKFMELAPQLLPDGIFLQNYNTDPEYPLVFAKLKNSKTTFIEPLLANFNINHGIWMDIFPLDGYPESNMEKKRLDHKKRVLLRRSRCGYIMDRPLKGRIYALLLRLLGFHKRTANTLAKYEKIISRYSSKKSKIICSHGSW